MSKAAPSARRGTNRRSRRETYRLPELLAEIAEVAGLPAALAIADVRGGTRTHFPAKCSDSHWLTRAVGREAADKLCDHFRVSRRGGVALTVPIGPTDLYDRAKIMAREMIDGGRSIAETARALRVTTRSVELWNAEHRRSKAAGTSSNRAELAARSAELGRRYAAVEADATPSFGTPEVADLAEARGLGEVTDDV